MNNTITLILFISILLLTVKYIVELKSDTYLTGILILFGITCMSVILNFYLKEPWLLTIGVISGMILAPLSFAIYLMKNKNKSGKNIRLLMLIPTIGLPVHWLFKILHLEGAAIVNLLMIIPIIVGMFIIFGKRQIKEMKPFQLILIFLIIDLITFLLK